MKDSEYHDLPGFDTIENSIRKPGHDGAAYITVHRRKHLGKLLDGIERRVDGGKELLAEADALLLVLPIGPSQIPSNTPTEDDRQGH